MNAMGLEPVMMAAVNRVREGWDTGLSGTLRGWKICSNQCCNNVPHVAVKHVKCGYWD